MHPFENPFRHSAEAKRHALRHFRAVIFDMDGVVTDTAGVHANAWKELFDSALSEIAGEPQPEFTAEDYLNFVDGRPREDGVRTLLEARNLLVPEGDPSDGADQLTINGLASRKQGYFEAVLARDGAAVFDTTVELIHELREQGIPTALVTSSRNGRDVLEVAGLLDAFTVIVDGTDALEMYLPGKPNPAIFLHASALLGVEAEDSIVIEDAASGVQAGHRGRYGMVVGLNRGEDPRRLKEAGAEGFAHPIPFNVIPHIDTFGGNGYTREEMKVVWETRKILGDESLQISCTAVRIPTFRVHAEAVTIETERPVTADAIMTRTAATTIATIQRTQSMPGLPLPPKAR